MQKKNDITRPNNFIKNIMLFLHHVEEYSIIKKKENVLGDDNTIFYVHASLSVILYSFGYCKK